MWGRLRREKRKIFRPIARVTLHRRRRRQQARGRKIINQLSRWQHSVEKYSHLSRKFHV